MKWAVCIDILVNALHSLIETIELNMS